MSGQQVVFPEREWVEEIPLPLWQGNGAAKDRISIIYYITNLEFSQSLDTLQNASK